MPSALKHHFRHGQSPSHVVHGLKLGDCYKSGGDLSINAMYNNAVYLCFNALGSMSEGKYQLFQLGSTNAL